MRLPLISMLLPPTLVSAGRDTGRPGHGLIGYGIEMYIPVCAYACQNSFSSNPLVCTDDAPFGDDEMDGVGMGSSQDGMTLPQNVSAMPSSTCHAESEPFLTSVAWCIRMKFRNTFVWQIEKWWQSYVVGNQPTDTPPGLSYGTALALVTSPPNATCMGGQILSETSLADEMLYMPSIFPSTLTRMWRFNTNVLRWSSALNGQFIYPLLLRPWRDSPTAAVIGDPPTRGQALFIGYLILLNIFLSTFKFGVHPGGFRYWWNDGQDEIMDDLANRLRVLSFANFVLLVLYLSRNNVFLWLTNWQHSTFVLLHCWVARIAVLEAILHSVIFLRDWIQEDRLADDQRIYELFLATHVALSILVFLGSWYHIIFRYEHQWGYETWLHVVFAVWGFDRLLRLLRTLRNGVRTAKITAIDDDYIRIDVRGIVGSGHVYLYFLDWRFWENHPFSIASSIIQQSGTFSSTKDIDSVADNVDIDPEKSIRMGSDGFNQTLETVMVFYLRLLEGGTRALRNRTQLPVLIEGAYGNHEDLSEYPTLICIAGGIGVTAVLPYMRAHPSHAFLYWSSRTQALVDSMKPLTHNFHLEVVVGQRLVLRTILESQLDNFAVVPGA
ncbi:hypothetical protein K449DRAFT_465632 [Hypoxylon sp. EC38]|nr:hypothetical protein K449DRAFT_465632 [Hypoxylon sp. EC38]